LFARLEGDPAEIGTAKRAVSLTNTAPLVNPALFRGVPPGFCRSVSRSHEPSLQISLQLSLTVIDRNRSGGIIFSLGWSLPAVVRLHSQAIRLSSYARHRPVRRSLFRLGNPFRGTRTGLSPSRGIKSHGHADLCEPGIGRTFVWADETHSALTLHCLAFKTVEASASGCSLFTRSY